MSVKEQTLRKLSIFCVLLGLPALHFLSQSAGLETLSFPGLLELEDGSELRIEGQLSAIEHKGSLTILTILQPLDVVIFEPLNATLGRYVDVEGEKGEFNGRPQVIAQSIEYR